MTPNAVLNDFENAVTKYTDICHASPSDWHRPDTALFSKLKEQLRVHAENGDARCQYALATIYCFGHCCDTQEQFLEEQAKAMVEASRWLVAAAKQGHWPAIDNLLTSGVGPGADRVMVMARKLEADRGDLIGRAENMPVYGPEFMQELCRCCFGQGEDKVT